MGQVALAQIDTLFENLEDVSDEQLDVLERKIASKSVSYTHLTLPTKRIV